MDSIVLKFNGKIKLDTSQVGITELYKEHFLLWLDEEMFPYGLRQLFYVPHARKMQYVIENPHLFMVQEIVTHYTSRITGSDMVKTGTPPEERNLIHFYHAL